MIIGITGNFGSGKSTVTGIFRKLGYAVIDADKIGHDILKKEAKKAVVKAFGKEILKGKGINRKKLGEIVFSNKSKLKKLNQITHPIIKKEITKQIKKSKSKKIAIDAAVLIESNWYKVCDKIIVVKVNKTNQLKRALKTKKYSKNQINNIIKNQMSQSKKLKYADYVVDNNKPLSKVEKQVKNISKSLIKRNI